MVRVSSGSADDPRPHTIDAKESDVNPLDDNLPDPRASRSTSSAAPTTSAPCLVEVNGRGNAASARDALLSEAPLLVGESWARTWCETMRTEGRGVHGGWPGTLPEARLRILQHLDVDLARRGMPLLNAEELVVVTTLVYARAKRDWLLEARGVKVPAPRPVARRSKS